MDAFDKLAKLAGASVESVGEGLPRTRAEALALGAKWYFTGAPCRFGHVSDRFVSNRVCRECSRIKCIKFGATPEAKDRMRKMAALPEVIWRKHQRKLHNRGDAILFAINQADRTASIGRASFDIVTQCPEPQRSQLQALVDRIKADPQAGKAVVGLLRTMRELRKAELAEMKAGVDAEAASG